MCYGGLTNKDSSLFFQFGYLDEESAEQQISFGETEEERQKIASKIQSDRDILNDDIYFYVSVNKSHQVIIDSSIFKRIPLCIRTSQSCNFISSDSAKQIAVTDSIKFANDLSYQLERNKVDKEYYWIITGHRPSDRPKTNKSSLNRYAETISTDQRRIINAQTGLIIPYEEFDYDW